MTWFIKGENIILKVTGDIYKWYKDKYGRSTSVVEKENHTFSLKVWKSRWHLPGFLWFDKMISLYEDRNKLNNYITRNYNLGWLVEYNANCLPQHFDYKGYHYFRAKSFELLYQ